MEKYIYDRLFKTCLYHGALKLIDDENFATVKETLTCLGINAASYRDLRCLEHAPNVGIAHIESIKRYFSRFPFLLIKNNSYLLPQKGMTSETSIEEYLMMLAQENETLFTKERHLKNCGKCNMQLRTVVGLLYQNKINKIDFWVDIPIEKGSLEVLVLEEQFSAIAEQHSLPQIK